MLRVYTLYFLLLSLVFIGGCQSHSSHIFPTSAPTGQQQLLITFNDHDHRQILPGGSSRAYHGGSNWTVPLTLSTKVKQLERQFSLRQQKIWRMDSIDVHCVVFVLEGGRDISTLIRSLSLIDGIKDVQVMNEFQVMASSRKITKPFPYNDPHIELQYGIHLDQLSRLHAVSQGQSIKVGVVDTLSDQQHPDLFGQITRQYTYVNALIGEQETHGTAVAGIISARANNGKGLVGLAPKADLYVYAACESRENQTARCNTFNVLQALEQAIQDDIQVLNLSIAGPYDDLVAQVIQSAVKQGMVVIAAINSRASDKSFPSTMSEVVGVGEIQADKKYDQDLFGDWLARSEKLSTLSGGGYQYFYGSSISTASVTGVAALYRTRSSAKLTHDFVAALASGFCDVLDRKEFTEFGRILKKSTTCQSDMRLSKMSR